jgi:hypothetical protein
MANNFAPGAEAFKEGPACPGKRLCLYKRL